MAADVPIGERFLLIQLPPNQWQRFKEIRLTAIKTDEQFFCTDYQRELNRDDAEWLSMLKNMYFVFDAKNDQLAAMAGLVPFNPQQSCPSAGGTNELVLSSPVGRFVSVWTAPAYRRQGLALKMLTWILQHDQDYVSYHQHPVFHSFQVDAVPGNEAGMKLYQNMGFQIVGKRGSKDCTFLEYSVVDHKSV